MEPLIIVSGKIIESKRDHEEAGEVSGYDSCLLKDGIGVLRILSLSV